ncbi:hypothetical protein [Burkholderia phage vB_BpP_HN04]|uniref:Uncharacterized protein n=1 Tax=Burkholderia phage vB_BpP_HN02 TaxID=3116925 RepID=A0AAX4JH04_9CAUD|nr:hypothetical protein [Burkholderia phage vB_BpP_HN01]
MKTPVRSFWGFVPFADWKQEPKNFFLPHSSRVALETDREDIITVVPDYEKPKTRPPFDL